MEQKKEEKFPVYRKTPLIKTGIHTLLLSESVYLFYNFITSSKPISDFINGNSNLIHSNIIPLVNQAAKYTHENYMSSFLIGAGAGISLYLADKLRTYVPKNDKYYKDGKHFFIQGYIKSFYDKYVKKIGYGLMGISALTGVSGGTYNSFFENSLKFRDNFSEIASNYNSLLFTAGMGVFLFSSKPLVTYATNLGRGIYEKYVFLKNALNFNSEMEEMEEKEVQEPPVIEQNETKKVQRKHDFETDKIKDLSKKVRSKKRFNKNTIKI
jgi:hypothetical protein